MFLALIFLPKKESLLNITKIGMYATMALSYLEASISNRKKGSMQMFHAWLLFPLPHPLDGAKRSLLRREL